MEITDVSSEELNLNSRLSEQESYSIIDFQDEQSLHSLRHHWDKLWWSSEDATESQSWQWQYLYWKHLARRNHLEFVTAWDSQGTCVALASFFVCRDRSSWVSKAAFL